MHFTDFENTSCGICVTFVVDDEVKFAHVLKVFPRHILCIYVSALLTGGWCPPRSALGRACLNDRPGTEETRLTGLLEKELQTRE